MNDEGGMLLLVAGYWILSACYELCVTGCPEEKTEKRDLTTFELGITCQCLSDLAEFC